MALAWEMLELARLIYNNSGGPEAHANKLADCHLYIGDILAEQVGVGGRSARPCALWRGLCMRTGQPLRLCLLQRQLCPAQMERPTEVTVAVCHSLGPLGSGCAGGAAGLSPCLLRL